MSMTNAQAGALQLLLISKGYDLGPAGADSDWGNLSQNAALQAITASPQVAAAAVQHYALAQPAGFYDTLRAADIVGPTISPTEYAGLEADIKAAIAAGLSLADTAYILATDYHETAGTLQPIREYGRGKGRPYSVPGKHGGQIAYGRGKVQLTWDYNYARADRELGLNGALIANYDLALDMDISARILAEGSKEGWFTNRKLADDLPRTGTATLQQFSMSRDIINGQDKKDLIAGHAMVFQKALQAGRYGLTS